MGCYRFFSCFRLKEKNVREDDFWEEVVGVWCGVFFWSRRKGRIEKRTIFLGSVGVWYGVGCLFSLMFLARGKGGKESTTMFFSGCGG